MTNLQYPPVRLGLVVVHFEELDFLWAQRQEVLFAPDWIVAELAAHEARAEAHLDALRLARGHAFEVTRPGLAGEETFAATAAALVFLQPGLAELEREVGEAFVEGSPEARDGIRLALRHSPLGGLLPLLTSLAEEGEAPQAAAAADVLAFHGIPFAGVERLLLAPEASQRVLALGALGRQCGLRERARLEALLEDELPQVRLAALRCAARSGLGELDACCRRLAQGEHPARLEALAFLGVLGDASSRERLEAAARAEESGTAAVAGLGALGQSPSLACLVELMGAQDERGRAAAAAFTRITGNADVFEDRPIPEPVDLHSLYEVDDEQAPAPEPEEELEAGPELEAEWAELPPRLSLAKVQAWMAREAARFEPGGRWQNGLEVSEAVGAPLFDRLSLEVRRDLQLGACARGAGGAEPLELEALCR